MIRPGSSARRLCRGRSVATTHNITTEQKGRIQWLYPLSIVTAIAMVVAWFPLGTLLHQQGQLSATAQQIAVIKREQQALSAQQRTIATKAEATMIARQLYQLVNPGQSLIQVLPGTSAAEGVGSGDPGYQPLVAPSSVSAAPVPSGHTGSSGAGGFFSRLVRTLEFWR